jgi:hypothetical protein
MKVIQFDSLAVTADLIKPFLPFEYLTSLGPQKMMMLLIQAMSESCL